MINPNYSQVKLIFLDVDGVVARDYYTPATPLVFNSLKELSKKYKVCLCTGRSYKSAMEIINGANLENNYHVIETGTRILMPGGGYANENLLTLSELEGIIKVANKFTDRLGFCQNGVWKDDPEELEGDTITILSINTFSSEDTKTVLDAISAFNQDFCISPMVSSFDPNGHHIHITNVKASKGFGTKYVQEQLGIPKAQSLGVGDSMGDLPMLNECGVKVVMGNAEDEVKAQGDTVIGDFDDNGLVDFINEELL